MPVFAKNLRGHEQYPIYSCRTHQRAITLGKIIEPEHAGDMHIHLPYLIFPWSFNEIRLVVSENSRGHEQYPIYSCRTHQRAITLGKIIEPEHAGDMRIHLWYLIFPWSFIEIRQAVSENLRGQERDGRTDTRTYGRTDARTHGHTDARTHGRSGDYMLPRNSSGSIKKHKKDLVKIAIKSDKK